MGVAIGHFLENCENGGQNGEIVKMGTHFWAISQMVKIMNIVEMVKMV